jgi:hypothetical protein
MQSDSDPNIPPILFQGTVPPVLAASQASVDSENRPTMTPRWKKRVLFLASGLLIAGGIGWATSPAPSLVRRADRNPPLQSIEGDVVRKIDDAMRSAATKEGLEIAEKAHWLAICRRISLALTGTSLSLEEVRALETIPEMERVNWWTDHLLKDRRTADYLGERWTRATVGTNEGPFLIYRRRKYADWIADQIEKNTPYDQLVHKLLVASGSWTDAPEVNFFTATMSEGDNKRPDVVRLAGRTSRAFLAQRIDCLQCHRDYLGNVPFPTDSNELREGEQQDFHRLAAFFSGVGLENPFVGLRNDNREYKARYLNEPEESLVEPSVPFSSDLLPQEGTTRERLANWITHPKNRAFARAGVNRVWALVYGKPWIHPVDSIPVNGPFPAGFETLVDDFIEHKFDLHRLIRIIIQSEAFQRDSRLEQGEPTEQHEAHWAVFPLTQLRPEQVAASIHQACRIKVIDENSSIISRLELFGGINDFTKDYGDRGEDEFDECPITIPQRLLVMNGNFIQERIKENPVMNAATRIATLVSDSKNAVEVTYLTVLNRQPTAEEREVFEGRLADKYGSERRLAVEDMYWTLLNSTEFLWNH